MPRLPDLEAWGVFARLSETRSFSRTADDLGIATATVSKAIARLEARLGVTLLNRTSRRLVLTDVGRIAAASATRMLAQAETMEAGAMEQSVVSGGLVRLAAPMSLGLLYIADLLPDFLTRHPNITVDLHLNDEFVDLVDAKFDLVLRIGAKPDPTLSVERVCRVRRLLVAAPSYLERCGTPTHPNDLAARPCLLYAPASRRWQFTADTGEEVSVSPSGPLWTSNSNSVGPAVLAGTGIAAQPEFLLHSYLATGRLRHLMPEWSLPLVEVHVVTPPGKYLAASVTTLLGYLLDHLLAEPWALPAGPEPT